ncbi:MAG: SH3 domain-containing protein, partial [Deltaproteobacteria bacterium]|nr:SH3 domain-containing protein [Deltaproteobacteria bacterium]
MRVLLWLAALALLAGPAAAGQAVVQWEYGYVNVRSAPEGRKVDRLDRGARVETLETRGDWVHVRYDGRDGWVVARSLRTVEAPPAQEPPRSAPEVPAAAEPRPAAAP